MDELEPIESHLRDDDPPDDAVLLLRGGPVTVEKLVEHAARQLRDFSLRGVPMASVSVDGTVGEWTAEALLRDRLWSRSKYSTARVGEVRDAGFEILPTHATPHFDIVLDDASMAEASGGYRVVGTATSGQASQTPAQKRKWPARPSRRCFGDWTTAARSSTSRRW